jgi:hypothetical protein
MALWVASNVRIIHRVSAWFYVGAALSLIAVFYRVYVLRVRLNLPVLKDAIDLLNSVRYQRG